MANGPEHVVAHLRAVGYAFVAPTPATQARVIARSTMQRARDLRGVFGWSLPFEPELLPRELRTADVFDTLANGELRSRIRVSTYGDDYFVHSAYPTEAHDAVFFGPDSYRFADLIRAETTGRAFSRVLDIGTGTGIGAIVAARCRPGAHLTMTDINPKALELARMNTHSAGITNADFIQGADLRDVRGPIDLALANPPYIIDDAHRAYRDGGGMHGAAVSLAMADMALEVLAPGGRLILYTASAIINGEDRLRRALEERATVRYRELDPDVFGEELERPSYADVERLAVVAAVIDKP